MSWDRIEMEVPSSHVSALCRIQDFCWRAGHRSIPVILHEVVHRIQISRRLFIGRRSTLMFLLIFDNYLRCLGLGPHDSKEKQ